ncbi:MAG TPA: hypothetical protein VGI03_09055 [Verrucomicrobiae bacterium]
MVMIAGVYLSVRRIRDGTGIPMLAVLGTVGVWYVGDAYYNDYANSYAQIFSADVLQDAWWEVAWFLVVFLAAVPYLHQRLNARYRNCQSGVLQLARFGVNHPTLQRQLDILFDGCFAIYVILVLIATVRVKGQILYFFFPFLGDNPEPWARARVGGGFSALLSFALYIQMMVTSVFGILAAVSERKRTMHLSIILCFLSWPYFLFDRTRNTILAVVIPAIISFAFLRLRGSVWKKIMVLAVCYTLMNSWMAFIIQNRSSGSITDAFKEKGFNVVEESKVHHEGLNMFEELCWINTFFENGTFKADWGGNYFSELVNPIPRVLWHGKPYIGIDYAIARGQGTRGNEGSAGDAGVDATISTGLIGQGAVNFSVILGPAFAAVLMSLWVVVLARQDLVIWQLGRLPLYAIGLILTFNLGRDITLITLYPFVFGLAIIMWLERNKREQMPAVVSQRSNVPGQSGKEQGVQSRGGLPAPQPLRKPMQNPFRRRRRIVTPPRSRPNYFRRS